MLILMVRSWSRPICSRKPEILNFTVSALPFYVIQRDWLVMSAPSVVAPKATFSTYSEVWVALENKCNSKWQSGKIIRTMLNFTVPGGNKFWRSQTPLKDEYAHLLMREQFDWCEDVENDIVMKDKSIAMDTDIPTVNTENLTVSSTDHGTATEPDGEYLQLPINHHCLENTKDDAASTCSATNDQYPQFPVDRNRSNCANDDIAVDITSTGPTTGHHVGDEYAQLPVHRDSDEEKSYLAVHNELPNANNGPVTAAKLDDSCVDLPHPEAFELVDTVTNGPVTAVELGDSHTHLPHPDEFDLVDNDENDLDMDVEDLEIDHKRHNTTDGPVAAGELVFIPTPSSTTSSRSCILTVVSPYRNMQTLSSFTARHSIFAEDTNPTDPLNHEPEMSITTKSSHDIGDTPQPVERIQGLDPQTPASISESVQASEPDTPPFSEEFINEYEYRSIVGSQDESIHHWNWFGCPVYNRSSTPPAVSLAVVQATPKVPKGRDELRVSSMMNRAIRYIDPVIVRLDSENEAILQVHGSEMVEACGQITYTHYSLHGNWMTDDFSMRRRIVPDVGTPSDGHLPLVMGFLRMGLSFLGASGCGGELNWLLPARALAASPGS
ncbi:hypothetical protein N7519_005739 [Penicillium mononematosum]|uniref:uncharacterized protein n=1 Tax=Penicillium mononematosum TaxID=268346 RepID=UPI0025480852|nr:uncharacterized protein N7519_005739 [Penicillium mononematosum]KAJ6184438.1 hypothetical protein N7519_005739 [Penicillium mononematosum]